MKNIYIVACALLLSLGAKAQHKESQNILEKLMWDDKMLNIMLDTRVDFQTSIQNGDVDEMSFKGQTFKLWLVGEIVPGIRYRVRHRFNKSQDAFPREGYSAATDQAWLAFDIGKQWTITAGKQSVQLGTYEYDYNPADIYLPTMVYNDFDGYKTGVNVAYKFAGQVLNLQVVNSDEPQFASEEYKNKAMAVNVLWEGSLFKDVLKTRWGYGAFQHEKDKFYNWLTAGTQLNIGKFSTELDYYLGSRNIDYGSVVDNEDLGARYVRDQSASLNLKYDFGRIKPFIKGTWSQRYDKDSDRRAYETKGIQAVVEYYPFTNPLIKDLRFHVMYAYDNTSYKGVYENMSNTDRNTILVGTRWLFKAK